MASQAAETSLEQEPNDTIIDGIRIEPIGATKINEETRDINIAEDEDMMEEALRKAEMEEAEP